MAEDERLKREKANRVPRQKRRERQTWWQGVNGGFRRDRKSIKPEDLESTNPQTEEKFE